MVRAVDDVSFTVQKGDIICIAGNSGAGKSTLLNVIGGLVKATTGEILFGRDNLSEWTEKQLSEYRLKEVGMVFQGCYMISSMNVRDNILLPAIAIKRRVDQKYYDYVIEKLDISDKLDDMPAVLSGGEKQRVAIARALINRPVVILADEPTGNLDSHNSEVVFNLLIECAKETHSSLLYVTHDKSKEALADRRLMMIDGKVYEAD